MQATKEYIESELTEVLADIEHVLADRYLWTKDTKRLEAARSRVQHALELVRAS